MHLLTKTFDTQAGFEYFWQGLKRLGIPKARALYHGRTRRFRVDVPCSDPQILSAVQHLDQEAQALEIRVQALDQSWGPDLSRHRYEE